MKSAQPNNSSFLEHLNADISAFSSLSHIYERLQQENEISGISKLYSNLFTNEICFAVSGSVTRVAQNEQNGPRFYFVSCR